MSSSTATDDVAGAERGAAFCAAVDDALKAHKPDAVPDESLQRVLSAAVRLYAAKSEDRERELAPFGDTPVNATDAVTAMCAVHPPPSTSSIFKCGTAAANANDGARTMVGETMNEIMVGELSEFAEGGYRVLLVHAVEF